MVKEIHEMDARIHETIYVITLPQWWLMVIQLTVFCPNLLNVLMNIISNV